VSQILVVPCPRYVRNKNRSEINLGMAFCQSSPSLHQPRLTLPPSPEQQRRIKRAREALDGMGRLDRVPRVEGQKIWFDHHDPANPCSRRKPAWLDPDILKYNPRYWPS